MKVRLDELNSPNYFSGFCEEFPQVGHRFFMRTEGVGAVFTDPVTSYNVNFSERSLTFKTKDSEYKLTLLEH